METTYQRLWLKHTGTPNENSDEVEFSDLRVSKASGGTLSQIDFRLRGDPSVGGKVHEVLTAAHAIGPDAVLYFVYREHRDTTQGGYDQYCGTGSVGPTAGPTGSDGSDRHGRYWNITIRVNPVKKVRL